MVKTRIAVFVSGGGTNLQALLDAEAQGSLPSGELVLVLSNKKGVYALERAAAAGVASVVVERGEDFEERIEAALVEQGAQMIVLAGFLSILSAEFTERWAGRIINVHPSLLPDFGGVGYYGRRVHEAVLESGVKRTGATVHYVNAEPDGGEIIMQKAVDVLPDDSVESLADRVLREAEWKILPAATEYLAFELGKVLRPEQEGE